MVRQAAESFRRMRPLNPRLAGLMPFTIFFYNWSGITSFEQMKPKPAMEQLRYQPVLLSWELWTPQVYAGTRLRPVAHVINDDEQGHPLANATLAYRLSLRDGAECLSGEMNLPEIPHFGTWSRPIEIDLPSNLGTGEYLLAGQILSAAGRGAKASSAADGRARAELRSTNFCELFIAGREWAKSPPSTGQAHWLYDPQGTTPAALEKLRVPFRRLAAVSAMTPDAETLIIGEGTWDPTLAGQKSALRDFVRRGGRVLCLRQDPAVFDRAWLPVKITFFTSSANAPDYPPRTRPFREQMNINPERPSHPAFAGLHRDRLRLWSDYTGWTQDKPGFPKVYPVTAGFKLDDPSALATSAVLADYDRGLEGVALCEMFEGEGSVVLSAFDAVSRVGLDPAADRLLVNLAAYIAMKSGHHALPLVERPIRWGDFPTECGTVCGSLNGLLVNAEWLAPPTDPSAPPMPPNAGAWNMAPGDQFVPRGRNPFGPYVYSTASSLHNPNPEAVAGTGFFRARIPAGKRFALTQVKNPGQSAAQFSVRINESPPEPATAIPADQTVLVRTPLPAGATELYVRYSGPKTLVLLETGFE